jgi:hypothetical protein
MEFNLYGPQRFLVFFNHDAIAQGDQGLLIIKDSWSHSDTSHSVGLL